MTYDDLVRQIKRKKSFLCVGLDADLTKIPKHLLKEKDPVFAFNAKIIDATAQYAVAYKPNLAFYESNGLAGWESLEKTVKYIKENYPEIFLIADAKRGDIGNTSRMYAKAFFEQLQCDAITVAPYMGEDSVKPFLEYEDKWVIVLALTSNQGAYDFQYRKEEESKKPLFQDVIEKTKEWGDRENMMYVVGATKADMVSDIRKIIPEHFLLVPGVGAQGGSLQEVTKAGITNDCGLIVNSSRGIIYADASENFDKAAEREAKQLSAEMGALLSGYNII